MGFEEYTLGLYPKQNSPLERGNDIIRIRSIVEEIQQSWPALQPDDVEIARLMPPKQPGQEILFSQTPEGLFQMFIHLGNLRTDDVLIGLSFAYSNPRSVCKPVCALAEWLMAHYALYGHIDPDLSPEQQQQGVDKNVYKAEQLCAVMLPSVDYNKWLWHSDAQTQEEAILRPGDAVERFMTPLYV